MVGISEETCARDPLLRYWDVAQILSLLAGPPSIGPIIQDLPGARVLTRHVPTVKNDFQFPRRFLKILYKAQNISKAQN